MNDNYQQYLDFANCIAKQAGGILHGYFDTDIAIQTKSTKNDLVSEADLKSEQHIVEAIQKTYPDHEILAEEKGEYGSPNEFKWIIDPLDGTTNFLHSLPIFAVNIALEHKGEIVVAVTYNPITREHFYAKKSGGSYLNGKKLSVSKIDKLATSMLGTGYPPNRESDEYKIAVTQSTKIHEASHGLRRLGSAALDLAYVACGSYDGFYEMGLNPWDIAAGILLVQEAGGTVTTYENGEMNAFAKSILATNGLIHEEMVESLRV